MKYVRTIKQIQTHTHTYVHTNIILILRSLQLFSTLLFFVWYFYFPVSQLFYLYFMHGSVNDVVKAAEVSFVYPVSGAKHGGVGRKRKCISIENFT